MYILVLAIMMLVPLASGIMIKLFGKIRGIGIAGLFAVGSFIMLFAALLAHIGGYALHQNLGGTAVLLPIMVVVVTALVLACVVICKAIARKHHAAGESHQVANKNEGIIAKIVLPAVLCAMLVLCFLNMHIYEPSFGTDMTMDKTVTILQADGVYLRYPGTGMEMQFGTKTVGKLDFIPTFEASICKLAGFDYNLSGASMSEGASAYKFITGYLPFWTILLHVACVFIAIRALFELLYDVAPAGSILDSFTQRTSSKRVSVYAIIVYLALILTWDEQQNPMLFDLIHRGWQAGTMLLMALIPLCAAVVFYAVRLIMRRMSSKRLLSESASKGASKKPTMAERCGECDAQVAGKTHESASTWKSAAKTVFVVFMLCLAVAVGGTVFPCMPRNDLVRNYKTQYEPQTPALKDVLSLSKELQEAGKEVYLAAPSEILYVARYYNPDIIVTYSRDAEGSNELAYYDDSYTGEQMILHQFMELGGDPDSCLQLAAVPGCNVVVLRAEASDETMSSLRFEEYKKTDDGYVIYVR